MLRRLQIKNFVLIDQVAISFHKGLNVITGETGAGKSVILAALSFLQGARHDASVIRQGAEMTTCEATFEIKKDSPLNALLHEAHIEFSLDEELIVKRELTANGKSRATINNQSASLALLKKIAPHLIEFSGQHAHLLLLEETAPLELLDAYATLKDAKITFAKAWQEERNLLKEIQAIEQGLPLRLRNIDICKLEIEEINAANLREGEEEEIFQEFQLLTHQEELKQKTDEVLSFLAEGKSAIMPQLFRHKANFERIIEMDPSLAETARAFISSVAELQEVSYELKRYHIKSNFSPDRLATINHRLKELSHLKKKYGHMLPEIEAYKQAQMEKLKQLENQDLFLEELKVRHALLKDEADGQAKTLTEIRTKCARKLEKSISREICSLNMPNAIFEITITSKVRSETGDDTVEFYITPNLGEKRINVQEASGGELARVALALKMVLVDMCEMPTIVFDEIDANIGGTTAALVGEKLSRLGRSVQVISITHFPQVALTADSHYRIQKFEQRGRTHSTVEQLVSDTAKAEEITRMLGGKSVTYSGT